MTKSQASLRLRQNMPKSARKESRKEFQKKSTKVSVNNVEPNNTGISFPAGDVAFKTLLSARFCSAIWSHISDCDETFNYWEPMHYLIFGKGLQTWEYSPEFGLRSYFYLMVHAAPLWICNKLFQPNPIFIFYIVRCLLGLMCALAEVFFYKAVCKEFGVHVGRICLAFQIFSAGMFISSTAFLPSSFAMYTFTAACAAWWQQKLALSVFFIALGSLLGWPFAALLGVPIAYDMMCRRKLYKDFILWSAISAVVILVPTLIIDSLIYGRLAIAPYNIIKYNVFGGAGPNLYGTEPFSFYLINGFLNFNFVWILALLSPLTVTLNYFFVPSKNRSTLNLPYWLSLSPMFLWLTVFMLQEHKEERFLFPIYPMICLCGAVSVDVIQKLYFRTWSAFKRVLSGTHYLDITLFITITAIVVTSWLGVSRVFALYKNYHAPLDLMLDLNRYSTQTNIPDNVQINVCVGKDWYRYPNSFFLPNTNWNIHFIKSEFSGILPAPYADSENATMLIHSYFNDKNREENSLYFDLNKCHFLLDLDVGTESDLEPNYADKKDRWTVLKSYPFLMAKNSSNFFRSFFIPFLSDQYVVYGNFSILQSVNLKIK